MWCSFCSFIFHIILTGLCIYNKWTRFTNISRSFPCANANTYSYFCHPTQFFFGLLFIVCRFVFVVECGGGHDKNKFRNKNAKIPFRYNASESFCCLCAKHFDRINMHIDIYRVVIFKIDAFSAHRWRWHTHAARFTLFAQLRYLLTCNACTKWCCFMAFYVFLSIYCMI